MREATRYLFTVMPPRAHTDFRETLKYVLTSSDIVPLRQALRIDARNQLYNAILSVMQGINGIDKRMYGWSVIKLYYSLFYSLRGILADAGHHVLYVGSHPLSLACAVGSSCDRRSGTTHEVVFRAFRDALPNHLLLSQQIAGIESLVWCEAERVEINYRLPRFPDPDVPQCLAQIVRNGVRRSVEAYMVDEDDGYTFDDAHAMVALPLRAIRMLCQQMALARMSRFADVDEQNVSVFCRDRDGIIPALTRLVRSAGV